MAYQAPTLPQIDTRGAVTALLQAGTNRGSLPGTLLGQYQDRVLAEEKAKLVQANADRTFGLQEANAKRLQAEYDRVNTLRNASAVVGKMNPLENTNTALISDLAARQAELDSKNLPSLGIETNGESTPVFSQKDLRSPKAFESRMKDTLLAQGLTHAEIAPIVEQRMQEIYPTTSAEARAAANTAQDKKLEIMSKLYTGKSGTTNVNINGSGVGGGATNTDSYNNSYSNIQKIMEAGNLPDSPNWWSGLVNTIRGQDTATKHNVSQAASNLMKFDPSIDANAAIFAVMSGIQNNYISKDSIAEPSMEQTKKLVADAKAIGNTSGRSRTKVGGDGSANLQSNEDSLRQLFLEDAKAREAILNSGLRGDTIYSDRVNDINPNTGNDNRSFARQLEEANKGNKSKGGTGKSTKKSIFKTDDTTTDSKDGKGNKEVEVESGMPGVVKLPINLPGVISSDTEGEVPTQVPKDNRTYSEFRNDLSRPDTLKETLIREDDQAKRDWLINHQKQGVIETNDSVMFPIGRVGSKSISNVVKRGEDALTKSYNKKFFDVGMQRTKNAEVRKVRKEFAKQQASKNTKNLDIPSVIRNKLDGLEMAIKRSDDLREIAILRKQHSDLLNSVATIK